MKNSIKLTKNLFVFVLLCFLASQVDCLVVSKIATRIDTFAYQPGGTLSMEAAIVHDTNVTNKKTLKAYVCTEREYANLPTDTYGLELECSKGTSEGAARCSLSAVLNDTADFTIYDFGRYRFVLLYCLDDWSGFKPITVQVNYTALNRGNQQLPYGDGPLPSLYPPLSIGWAMLLILFLWTLLRNPEHRVPLHFIILPVVLLKIAVVVISMIYWSTYARTGHRMDTLGYIKQVVFALSETSFFCVLVVISKGWNITRFSLPSGDMKTMFLALVILLTTLFWFSFYSEDYYFLSLMIMYFFMLPKIFSNVTKNIRKLETQLWVGTNIALPNVPLDALSRKLTMFRAFRTTIIVYLGSILVVNSLKIVMIWYWDWANIMVNELVGLGVFSVILFFLRPREHGVFADISEMASLQTLQTILDRTNNQSDELPAIEPWDTQSTMIIEWPNSMKDKNAPEDLASKPLSVAIQEDYDRSQHLPRNTYDSNS